MAEVLLVTVFLFLAVGLVPCPSQGAVPEYISDEHRLYKTLMADYEKWVRPVSHPDQAINVSFGMTLQTIIEVDEYKGYLTLLTWWNMRWEDVQLKWNSSEYSGISRINIPRSEVWMPDLAVYNSVGDHPVYLPSELVIASSDGYATYVPPWIVNALCTFDYTWYPYDEQTCEVKVGSWTHNGQKINLILSSGEVDTSTFVNHPGWKLQTKPVGIRRNVVKYECCPEAYIDVVLTLKITRESSYVSYVLVTPGVIMAFLIPFIFLFPPEAGEKITLGVGILLGYVLLLIIGDYINSGMVLSHPPIIFRYYIANIVIVGVSMIASMTVVQLWRKRGRAYPPPRLVSKIFVDALGCIMCVKRSNYQRQPLTVNVEAEAGQSDTEKIGQDVADADVEWRLLSIVLDRMLFIIFLVISVIVAILMISI